MMELPVDILLHTFAATAALLIGVSLLVMTKGTQKHRWLGRVWACLMLIVIASSFSIRDLGGLPGGFSVIHLLSVFTLFTLAMAIVHIRKGRVRKHMYYMVGTFLGLVGAGAGALAPGRTLSQLLGYG
ncbi:MAG: DUF2306 domain-containing protein [Oleiphilaceae bacterium]|nr:DUF2306 domain-containing protein [Oleiphilaceae bacterium]